MLARLQERMRSQPATIAPNYRQPHPKQQEFIESSAKRKVVRAGRRGGKTVGVAVLAVKAFMAGRRVLYAVPTTDQLTRFWFEVKRALEEPLQGGVYYKNETEHIIERTGTEQRIRAKTAWNADTLRGDFADLLILDEWQLMNEDAWGLVGAPMLLDNNGDAVFVYTPPSIRSRSTSKATDKLHAAKLFKRALADTTGRWQTFHFTSHDNPHISVDALAEITQDMTALAYEQEIMAQDKDDSPDALWTRALIETWRVAAAPDLARIVVAVDPSTTGRDTSDECGIAAAGVDARQHGYPLADRTVRASPDVWARKAVALYHELKADCIVAESNNGGEMVALTIRTVDPTVRVKLVHASRGKAARAEPVVALYEQGKVHHVGALPALEDELCTWSPTSGMASPNRLDALVWALTDLLVDGATRKLASADNKFYG